MKQVIYAILLAGVLCAPALAQRVEIFGGAQFEHLQPSYNAAGWNASLTGCVSSVRWVLIIVVVTIRFRKIAG